MITVAAIQNLCRLTMPCLKWTHVSLNSLYHNQIEKETELDTITLQFVYPLSLQSARGSCPGNGFLTKTRFLSAGIAPADMGVSRWQIDA
jgi:hypothetical protein